MTIGTIFEGVIYLITCQHINWEKQVQLVSKSLINIKSLYFVFVITGRLSTKPNTLLKRILGINYFEDLFI